MTGPASITLLRVLWSSLAASLVIAASFALLIRGLVRFSDLRGSGRTRPALAYAALATAAGAVTLAAVVYGVILMAQKS